jgi:uncharacterized membrane protein YphA (DoxX/SURF4 family)
LFGVPIVDVLASLVFCNPVTLLNLTFELFSTTVYRRQVIVSKLTPLLFYFSLGLTGIADRLAAFILACYCIVTAMLWKQFWRKRDFRWKGKSQGRELFWDFLKNLAIAGGFLLLAFGTDPEGVQRFLANPLSSSHPYTLIDQKGA